MKGSPGLTGVPPRRREHTRARLVAASADVFADKALRRVTVDDVVAAAGFTRGAFYSNFSAIDELFFEVYAHQAELMQTAVRSAVDAIPSEEFSFESLGPVLDALRPFGRRWFLIQNEFALLAVRDAGARERFAAEVARLQGGIESTVARVVELLGRKPVVSVQHLTDVLIALYLHSLGNEHLGTGNLDSERLVSEVLPPLILGLSTPID